jgi:hypothetical protein
MACRLGLEEPHHLETQGESSVVKGRSKEKPVNHTRRSVVTEEDKKC